MTLAVHPAVSVTVVGGFTLGVPPPGHGLGKNGQRQISVTGSMTETVVVGVAHGGAVMARASTAAQVGHIKLQSGFSTMTLAVHPAVSVTVAAGFTLGVPPPGHGLGKNGQRQISVGV